MIVTIHTKTYKPPKNKQTNDHQSKPMGSSGRN